MAEIWQFVKDNAAALSAAAAVAAVLIAVFSGFIRTMTKAGVGLFKHFKGKVFNRRFPVADLDEWRQVDPLLLWQAGCLWAGIKPQYPVTFDNPAYSAFSMLLRAAEHGELKLIKIEPPRKFAFSQASREELVRYAIQKNNIPEFLSAEPS